MQKSKFKCNTTKRYVDRAEQEVWAQALEFFLEKLPMFVLQWLINTE